MTDEQHSPEEMETILTNLKTLAESKRESCCSSPPPCSASPVAQPPRDVSELYHELLYAVERKFPGESRHETALRYIRDTEERVCEAGSCKKNKP